MLIKNCPVRTVRILNQAYKCNTNINLKKTTPSFITFDVVPNLKRQIRISLVNVVGANEAGVDGGGLLREFLTEATKAAVDPNRGLFRADTHNRIYPNSIAKKLEPHYRNHYFIIGRLVGKALYEQTLLELPFAAFFLQYCIEGRVMSAIDFLATMDPDMHKNLLSLRNMDNVESLGKRI